MQCSTCRCPVSFTAADVENFRSMFLAQGGSVGPAASSALEAKDFVLLKVLLALPLLLLGWWPFQRTKSKTTHGRV